MRADLARATAEAARQVGGIDAARGAAGLRGDEIALRARVLHRRLHLRILQIEILVAQLGEFVSAGASMPWLRTLGFGFSIGFSVGLGFSGSGFFSSGGGGGGGGGFGFSTMSCATRSLSSSGFIFSVSRFGNSRMRMRQQRGDDQQDAQQLLEAAFASLPRAPREARSDGKMERDSCAASASLRCRTASETLP